MGTKNKENLPKGTLQKLLKKCKRRIAASTIWDGPGNKLLQKHSLHPLGSSHSQRSVCTQKSNLLCDHPSFCKSSGKLNMIMTYAFMNSVAHR